MYDNIPPPLGFDDYMMRTPCLAAALGPLAAAIGPLACLAAALGPLACLAAALSPSPQYNLT